MFWLMITSAILNLVWSGTIDDPDGKALFYVAGLVCSVGAGIVHQIDSRGG